MDENDQNYQMLRINSKELPFTSQNNKLNLFSIANALTKRDPSFIDSSGLPMEALAELLYIDYEKVEE